MILVRNRKGHQSHREEGHVKMKAEIKAINQEAKECQRWLATPRCWKEARKDSSLEPSEEAKDCQCLAYGLFPER